MYSNSEAVLFSLNSSTPSQIAFQVSIPGFSINEKTIRDKTFVVPTLKDAYPLLNAGDPDLPKLFTTLIIPGTGTFKPIIVSSEYIDFPDYFIAPSSGNESRNAEPATAAFSEVYSRDAFYPGNLVASSDPYVSGNSRKQVVQLYPFQYNPISHILRVYYHMEVKLERIAGSGKNTLTAPGSNFLPDIVGPALNPSVVPSMKSSILPASKGRMLIICPPSFRETLKPFVTWKNQCGITTETVDASQFTDAGQIKEFVKNVYTSRGDLTYLLLVGDAEQVPSFHYPLGASDNYYSYLAGDDHYPDILVGRFSAISTKDLDVQVRKTIQYEKEPGADANWLGKVTGLASTMGPGDDGETDYQHVHNMITALKGFTYTSSSEFFDGTQGGDDEAGNPTTQPIMSDFDAGTGLILYTGHGSTSTWATGRITRSALGSLTNNGKYPIIWSTACETGNFDGSSCLAEAWMTASDVNGNPEGAVAALMASGTQTSYPPMEAQDEMVNQLVKAGTDNTLRTFGGLSVSGLYRMNDIYGEAGYALTDTWILFGDPSLQVRTCNPRTMKVVHKNYIGEGRMEFRLSTNTTFGTACLTTGDKVLGTGSIVNGEALITLIEPIHSGNLTLTVTSFNYIPYQAEIHIVNVPSAPETYFPVNHSERIPIHAHFSWDSGSAALPSHFLFYLGTDNPPTNLANGIEVTSMQYTPAVKLNYNQKYYWRIDAVNDAGISNGKVLDFETLYGADEDFENVSMKSPEWLQSGSAGWMIEPDQVFGGTKSCRSGFIEGGNFSSLIYPCNVKACDYLGFWLKTDVHAGSKLQLLLDDALAYEWENTQDWDYYSFTIEQGNHKIEWKFLKDTSSSSFDDAAWLDDISLPLHDAMIADAGEGRNVCQGDSFKAESHVENYNSIEWKSSGDGTFDDPNLIFASYLPGPGDILNGEVLLSMQVNGFENCQATMSTITIHPSAISQINLPTDTIATYETPMVLDASSTGAVSWLWLPGNETGPTLTIDSLRMDRGSKSVTLQVTNQNGCTAQKLVKIHFPVSDKVPEFTIYPNPCRESFTIEPEDGAAKFRQLSLYNTLGKVVWQKDDINIVNRENYSLPALPVGTYFLVAGNQGEQKVKTLVVR